MKQAVFKKTSFFKNNPIFATEPDRVALVDQIMLHAKSKQEPLFYKK
ncbi:hypothetical protein [Tumebacillus flagellatus]|nr:hypothetical protein [Tumebacillus flagellatus]